MKTETEILANQSTLLTSAWNTKHRDLSIFLDLCFTMTGCLDDWPKLVKQGSDLILASLANLTDLLSPTMAEEDGERGRGTYPTMQNVEGDIPRKRRFFCKLF